MSFDQAPPHPLMLSSSKHTRNIGPKLNRLRGAFDGLRLSGIGVFGFSKCQDQ